MAEAIRELIGEAPLAPGKVKLELPSIVENGNTVPLTVSVESPMTEQDPSTMSGPQLTKTVNFAATWSVLREVIRLADQAPALTEEQLRFRLLTLVECAAPRFHSARRSRLAAGRAMPPNQLPAASRHHKTRPHKTPRGVRREGSACR